MCSQNIRKANYRDYRGKLEKFTHRNNKGRHIESGNKKSCIKSNNKNILTVEEKIVKGEPFIPEYTFSIFPFNAFY